MTDIATHESVESQESLRPDGSGTASRPWYLEEGVEGMDLVVERLKRIAGEVEPRAHVSSPFVDRFAYDCDGDHESVYVVVYVSIPADLDGMDFRNRFFDRLEEISEPENVRRLAVGIRRLC